MIFKQTGLIFATAVLISGYSIISGCNRVRSDSDKKSIPKEVILGSIINEPDIDGKPSTEAMYKTCQIFDLALFPDNMKRLTHRLFMSVNQTV